MTGKLRRYRDTGEEIAERWGRIDGGDWHNHIVNMEKPEMTVCLLAAAVKELERIRETLWNFKHDDPPSIPDRVLHGPADGRFRALQRALGRVRIDELDSTGLSFAAWRILRLSGLVWSDEITPERLKSIKRCGPKTIAKLMVWKSGCSSKTTSETENSRRRD